MERPTAGWRSIVAEQASLPNDEAWARHLWPAPFIQDVDAALDHWESEVSALVAPSDDQVLGAVERVVVALNDIAEATELIETGEREDLCTYIEYVLGQAGIDVAALEDRNGLGRYEITDRWREW